MKLLKKTHKNDKNPLFFYTLAKNYGETSREVFLFLYLFIRHI